MRIHLALLAAAPLFVLAVPRSPSSQAQLQGIPLGDLVRPRPAQTAPKPDIPTERNPPVSQLTPGLGGTSSSSNSSTSATLGTPGSTVGTPTTAAAGGAATNLTTPGLPSATPTSSTVGNVPTTGMPATTGGTTPTPPPGSTPSNP